MAARKLSFTGSTAVGRTLLVLAARNVVSCSTELGGNAPFVVFAEAGIGAAVEGAMVAQLRHGGESCIATNRVIVESTIAEEYSTRLTTAMAGLRVGPAWTVAPRWVP